jgi:hypothetical protein
VAITRHGETVGFYVPVRRKREQADLEALRKAGEQLDAMIAAAGTTEDELVEDFNAARRVRVCKPKYSCSSGGLA